MATVTDSEAEAWTVLQSHLMALGYLENVDIGEPKAPPSPTAAAIVPMSGRPDVTVMNAPRYIHMLSLRFYGEGIGENREKVERELSQIRANILADIWGDFTLGGNVVHVIPRMTEWKWGWVAISGTMFRLLDITIGVRLDVTYTFAE